MSASEELQDFIVATLRADAGVTALVAQRVYDNAPSGVEYPYISLGPASIVPDDYDCIDGRIETQQIDCWDRAQGAKRGVKAINDAVKSALHDVSADLGVNALVSATVTLMQVMDDPDGITAHGVLQLACEIEEH